MKMLSSFLRTITAFSGHYFYDHFLLFVKNIMGHSFQPKMMRKIMIHFMYIYIYYKEVNLRTIMPVFGPVLGHFCILTFIFITIKHIVPIIVLP